MPRGQLAADTAQPYAEVGATRDGLRRLEREMLQAGDGRAVFLSTYVIMTMLLESHLGTGYFEDDAYVSTAIVRFADYYRAALHAFERGWVAATPAAWQRAHNAARIGCQSQHQLLLLGIVAHLRDLANVVAELYDETVCERQHRDFRRIGRVVLEAVDPSQRRLGACLTPGFTVVDFLGLELDEALIGRWILSQREDAWRLGLALARARTAAARAQAAAVMSHTSCGARARSPERRCDCCSAVADCGLTGVGFRVVSGAVRPAGSR